MSKTSIGTSSGGAPIRGFFFFFLNDPAPPEISTLPLPDALPILMPFEALATPQVTSPNVPEIQAPQGAKRSDISFAAPQATEKLDQPTATVPPQAAGKITQIRSEEHTSELQSRLHLVCRLLLEKT